MLTHASCPVPRASCLHAQHLNIQLLSMHLGRGVGPQFDNVHRIAVCRRCAMRELRVLP
jgi:hypothetical protein